MGKKKRTSAISLIILALVLASVFLVFNLKEKPLLSPQTFSVLQNCSNESIISVWNSVFYESPVNLRISANTTRSDICEKYFARKIRDSKFYLLRASNTNFSDEGRLYNRSEIEAVVMEINNSEFLNSLINISDYNEFEGHFLNYPLASRNVNSVSEADNIFREYFKITPATWEYFGNGYKEYYTFEDEEMTSYEDRNIDGVVFINYSMEGFSYSKVTGNFSFFGCSPLWQCLPWSNCINGTETRNCYDLRNCNTTLNKPITNRSCSVVACVSNWSILNRTCISDETILTLYNDTNSCNLSLMRNITGECDYERNGVIGNFSSFASDVALAVYINSAPANISEILNTTRTVEFVEENKKRIKFDYNFSVPLNMKRINIKRQPYGANWGYIIVNNISAAKTVWVDQINETSRKICIKNEHVNNISELSSNCNKTNEYFVECPGSNSSFFCNITERRFYVSGLTSSAAREMLGGVICQPNWSCNNWSSCVSGTSAKIRTCMDINNCNNISSMPLLTEACPLCTTDWNCTAWNPKKCPKTKNQTRICTDRNSCGTDDSKPNEVQACKYKSNFMWLIISLSVLVVLAIIVAIVIYIINQEKPQPFNSQNNQPTIDLNPLHQRKI